MEIKTKFNLDDTVYPIVRHGYDGVKMCETCNGTGIVKINNKDKEITCPDCYGRGGHKQWVLERWVLSDDIGKIGKVEVALYSKKYPDHKDEHRYMLSSTGVGSGTLWYESDLFISSDEAIKECELRNSVSA